MEGILNGFKYFPQFDAMLSVSLLIFVRFFAFAKAAPVLSRKEIPTVIQLSFALIMTIIFVSVLKVEPLAANFPLIIGIIINAAVGLFVGFVATSIFSAVTAGGDMINMQMGLSAAMMFDKSTGSQSSLLGSYFNLVAAVIYVNIGGMYWLIKAFERTFDIVPVTALSFSLQSIATPEYLIMITSSVLYVGLQIAAPILLASLGQDIILGIISRTAPQVNVFTLSFLFKPILGAMIMIFILPRFLDVITDYFEQYSFIFQ